MTNRFSVREDQSNLHQFWY